MFKMLHITGRNSVGKLQKQQTKTTHKKKKKKTQKIPLAGLNHHFIPRLSQTAQQCSSDGALNYCHATLDIILLPPAISSCNANKAMRANVSASRISIPRHLTTENPQPGRGIWGRGDLKLQLLATKNTLREPLRL